MLEILNKCGYCIWHYMYVVFPKNKDKYSILLTRPVSCLHYFVSPIFVYAGLIHPLYKNVMHIRFCVLLECIQDKR